MGLTMALVPIIYTSLLIFTSLLLFVILVSYISFKSKDKNTGILEFKENQQNSFAVRPTNLNFNDLSVKPVAVQHRQSINYPIINSEENQAGINIRNSFQSISRNDNTNYSNSPKIKRNINVEAYDKFQESKRINQKPAFSRNRIEIMNNSIQYNNTSIETEIESIHSLNHSGSGISEKNLFNYYSDREDLGLVMLSAQQS